MTRRLLLPGLMTAVMLVVLLGLGSWQVHRMNWKLALLAQIDRAEAAPPVPLPATPEPFTKVSVTGTFSPGQSALYAAIVETTPAGPAMGARLIVPLTEDNGRVVLVDRGWVPLARTKPIDLPSGPVTVVGYVRFGDAAGWFSARDDLAARRFFTLDPKAIGAALGRPDVPPFVLVALGPPRTGDVVENWPAPARQLPRPPNNHLSYVITWYGLALALLVIFLVWARKAATS